MIRRGGRSAIRRPPHPAPPAGSDLVPSLPPAVVGSSDGSDAPMAVRESAASLGAAAPGGESVVASPSPSGAPTAPPAAGSALPVGALGPLTFGRTSSGEWTGARSVRRFARTPDAPTGVHGPAPSGACNPVGSDAGSLGAVGSAAATIRSVPREETGRARQESSPARPSAPLPYTLLRKPRGWSATG